MLTTRHLSSSDASSLRKTVLIVDDDEWTRFSVQKHLKEEEFDARAVTFPEEGLALCARNPRAFGLILLDLRFPYGECGLDYAQDFKKLTQSVSCGVVGITSHMAFLDKGDWTRFGMDDLLLKPLHKWLLVSYARRYC
ncbi:response regulator [Salipiger bermudensis]|nr:response regulator [Salipiger bermudensis]